jgi:hypothetical protein
MSTIGGGYINTSSANYTTVGGGFSNTASGNNSTIGGGKSNTGVGDFSIVGGGEFNCAAYCYSTIGGGRYNTNVGAYSIIGGGRSHITCSSHTTISGGRANNIDNSNNCYSTIAGGFNNCIIESSCLSFIGGGCSNTIAGSISSAILGGCNNTISNYSNSFIIGSSITATVANYSFMNNLCVLGNSTATGSKSFKIKHPNKEKENTHYLVHSVIETPTAGDNLYRYIVESDGIESVKIMLPDYFGYLNKDIQIWVNASDNFGNGYGVIDKELKIVEVFTNVKGYYNVLIIGTRKDKGVSEWKGPEIEKIKK